MYVHVSIDVSSNGIKKRWDSVHATLIPTTDIIQLEAHYYDTLCVCTTDNIWSTLDNNALSD